MSEFSKFRLGDLAEITSSKRIFYAEYVPIGVPFFRSKEVIEKYNNNEVSTELFITEEKYTEIKDKFGIPQIGDILLTSVGTLGIPYIVQTNERFYFKDGNLTWFRNFSKSFSSKYLYYFFVSSIGKQKLDEIKIGSTQEALTIMGLKSIELSIPPLPEQEAIVLILSSIDHKIDLLYRQNKTLEALAKMYFRQLVIEEAGDEWESQKLGEYINIYDSKRIPLSSIERDKKRVGNLYPYYGAATIMDSINDYLFDGEYILMGEDGTVQTDEGYPVLQYATDKFWVNNHSHVLTAREPFNNYYLWFFLKQCNISNIITGAVQPKINQANLKDIEFPKPDDKTINKINTYCGAFFIRMLANNNQICTLTALRDTLLPKLISGEIRVNL